MQITGGSHPSCKKNAEAIVQWKQACNKKVIIRKLNVHDKSLKPLQPHWSFFQKQRCLGRPRDLHGSGLSSSAVSVGVHQCARDLHFGALPSTARCTNASLLLFRHKLHSASGCRCKAASSLAFIRPPVLAQLSSPTRLHPTILRSILRWHASSFSSCVDVNGVDDRLYRTVGVITASNNFSLKVTGICRF